MDSTNVWKGLAYGGIASCVAETATIPFDVVKVRMQVQQGNSAYKGSIDALVKIFRHEGGSALFKGLTPALLRQATYGSMRYGFYTPIKSALGVNPSTPKHEIPIWKKIIAGSGAGAISSAICNPTDLIKIRMQADGMKTSKDIVDKIRYRNIGHAFSTVIKEEGILGLWKGVGPTCGRATVLAAVELASYDEIKSQILGKNLLKEGLSLHIITALGAGFLSAFASSPFDVVKSRVMGQPIGPNGQGLLYRGMIDCFNQSIKQEGILSLWKGFVPNYTRVGPRVLIIFVVMEQLKLHFG